MRPNGAAEAKCSDAPLWCLIRHALAKPACCREVASHIPECEALAAARRSAKTNRGGRRDALRKSGRRVFDLRVVGRWWRGGARHEFRQRALLVAGGGKLAARFDRAGSMGNGVIACLLGLSLIHI